MGFVGDPLTVAQPVIVKHLAALHRASAVDSEISADIRWRPHVWEATGRRAWYIHTTPPDTDTWFARVAKAKSADTTLRIGVAAPADALLDENFLLHCAQLDAEIIKFDSPLDADQIATAGFASVDDFVIETRAQLSFHAAKSLLDLSFQRAISAPDTNRKGVLFEVTVALMLSQVSGFEVHDVGISNRTQQMDVLVQNRNVGGALSGSPLVLAEAKNWKDPVTPTEYAEFVRKLRSRHGRAKLGFLVTSGVFTSGVTLERRRESEGETLVVLVDGATFESIWTGPNSITENIEKLSIAASIGD